MDNQPAHASPELLAGIAGAMADAISERDGETRQQQLARSQTAVGMILGLHPRDVIEAMLAGHCVMFHAVMLDSVRTTLRGEEETARRATRSNLVALNSAFTGNLDRLRREQRRPAEARRDAAEIPPDAAILTENPQPPPGPVASPPAHPAANQAAPGQTPQAEISPARTQLPPGPAHPVATQAPNPTPPLAATAPASQGVPDRTEPTQLPHYLTAMNGPPTAAVIAACQANPEAMAALEAGDAARFARAMGVAEPSEEFLAAANTPGSPFDRRSTSPGPGSVRPATPKA